MSESFGALLRTHRVARALTQERLAERAGISATGVAALESGRRRAPRLTTVSLLADALGLDDTQRAEFANAALANATPSTPAPANATPSTPALADPTSAAVPATDVAPSGAATGAPMSTADRASATTTTSSLAPIGGWSRQFVGRAAELSLLESAWTDRRRLVLIEGEAGLGKTRLADRVAQWVAGQGAAVVSGRWSEEQLGPFEGFVAVLRQCVDRLDDSSLAGCGELIRLLPELRTRLPEHAGPTRADPGIERRLLSETVARTLTSLSPTLVVLDDLHWTDSASLGLLAYLATEPTLSDVVILATLRSTDVDAETAGRLADLGRRTDVLRLPLGRLEPDDLVQLIELVAGDDLTPDQVLDVAKASEGNAFFAEELAEHAAEELSERTAEPAEPAERAAARPHEPHAEPQPDPLASDGVTVPDRIRATIDARVATLSPNAQALLRTGCVLGREFDPQLAGRLAALDADNTISAAEDALLSGLLRETSPPRLTFSHALVQRAIDASLSTLRRTDIHRRAATALEETGATTPETVIAIARHWREVAAADPTAAPSAARWAVRAGDAALSVAATDEAIEQYELASDWWTGTTAEHADALVRLAAALASCGRREEADTRFAAALAIAKGLGDVTLQARAALGLARRLVLGSVDARRVAELEEVLALLGGPDDPWWALVAGMLMRQLLFDQAPGAAERYAQLSVQLVAALDRPDVDEEVLLGIGSFPDFLPVTDPEPLQRLSRQMLAVASERRELLVVATAWWGQAWSALERADPVDWPTAVAAYQETADQLGLAAEQWAAASLRSVAAQIEGRFSDATALGEEAWKLGREANEPNADTLRLARAALLAVDTGGAAEMLPAMIALTADFESVASFRSGLALTAAMAGDHDLARQILAEHGGQRFRDVATNVEWAAVIAFFANASVLVGDTEHAAALYECLVNARAVTVRVGAMTGWWGPVDHHLGALCHLLGRHEEARAHLERALAVEERLDAAPFQARSQVLMASVLEELEHSGGDAATRRAAALREEATATRARLGIPV